MSIEKIWAREILDSRGNPTVEVDLYTAKGDGRGMGFPQPPLPLCWVWQVSEIFFLHTQGPGGARPGSQGWIVESGLP